MKHISLALASLATALLLFTGCASTSMTHIISESDKEAMQKTCQFIKASECYFIATIDEGEQPRVRPFGTVHIFEDKLYIQTGRIKNVGRQLLANGKVELCAKKDGEWIRVAGILQEDPRREAKASMLDAYPSLKSMYSADDGNTLVLFFQPGSVTSTIYSFSQAPEVMHF